MKISKKNWKKIGIGIAVVGTLAYLKTALFPDVYIPTPTDDQQQEEQQQPVEAPKPKPKNYINVFFIAQNEKGEEVYRAVKREYNKANDGSQLKFAIKTLLQGPDRTERAKGAYTEIPAGTRLISIEETPGKTIINLSGDFENGGGTNGLYKRLFQLIKTANLNTKSSVYLYLDGKQVDVIGGDGIMLNQPLTERSMDE